MVREMRNELQELNKRFDEEWEKISSEGTVARKKMITDVIEDIPEFENYYKIISLHMNERLHLRDAWIFKYKMKNNEEFEKLAKELFSIENKLAKKVFSSASERDKLYNRQSVLRKNVRTHLEQPEQDVLDKWKEFKNTNAKKIHASTEELKSKILEIENSISKIDEEKKSKIAENTEKNQETHKEIRNKNISFTNKQVISGAVGVVALIWALPIGISGTVLASQDLKLAADSHSDIEIYLEGLGQIYRQVQQTP